MTPDVNRVEAELLPADEVFSGLIFDCDGTLVDTAPTHLFAYNQALRSSGLEIPLDFYLPRFGLSPQALLAEFSANRGVGIDVVAVIAEYSQVFQSDLSRLREIPLVTDLARRYYGRVPMAVASNGTRANVERTLRAVGLRDLFDEIVAIEDVEHGKPAPDIYLEAARRLGIPPAECVVFEDTDEGLRAARDAHMRERDIRPYIVSLSQ